MDATTRRNLQHLVTEGRPPGAPFSRHYLDADLKQIRAGAEKLHDETVARYYELGQSFNAVMDEAETLIANDQRGRKWSPAATQARSDLMDIETTIRLTMTELEGYLGGVLDTLDQMIELHRTYLDRYEKNAKE